MRGVVSKGWKCYQVINSNDLPTSAQALSSRRMCLLEANSAAAALFDIHNSGEVAGWLQNESFWRLIDSGITVSGPTAGLRVFDIDSSLSCAPAPALAYVFSIHSKSSVFATA